MKMPRLLKIVAPQDLNLAFSKTMSASIAANVDDSITDSSFKRSVGPDQDRSVDEDGANLMHFFIRAMYPAPLILPETNNTGSF